MPQHSLEVVEGSYGTVSPLELKSTGIPLELQSAGWMSVRERDVSESGDSVQQVGRGVFTAGFAVRRMF